LYYIYTEKEGTKIK